MPSKADIQFCFEGVSHRLTDVNAIKDWIRMVCKSEKKSIYNLVYVFCDDEYLLNINKTYLNHNDYTDIITFDLSDGGKLDGKLDGEIYISLPRVKENAKTYKTKFPDELHRVIIHGVLHLLGYDDRTEKSKMEMRIREDELLLKRRL